MVIGPIPEQCSNVSLVEIIDITNAQIDSIINVEAGTSVVDIRNCMANALYVEDFEIQSSNTNKVTPIAGEEKVSITITENEEVGISLVGKTSGQSINVIIKGYIPTYAAQ